MKGKSFKMLLSVVLLTSMFSFTAMAKPEPAAACYPAYKCMSLPSSYKLVYQNPDRRHGLFAGGIILGGLGFFGGKRAGVANFAVATYVSWKETYKSSLSFKTYIKKSDKRGYKYKSKTVYYTNTKYRGKTTTKYRYHN